MGRRGPKPKPSIAHQNVGSWRGLRRLEDGEPVAPDGAPPCPFAEDDTKHRAVWGDVYALLAGMRVLTVADKRALERYVREWVRYLECAKHVADHGESYVAVDAQGNEIRKPTPEAKTALQLQGVLNQLEDRFGLSPSARASIRVPPAEPEQDPSAAHFGDTA